jgi:hypothetical protein
MIPTLDSLNKAPEALVIKFRVKGFTTMTQYAVGRLRSTRGKTVPSCPRYDTSQTEPRGGQGSTWKAVEKTKSRSIWNTVS